MRLNGHLFAASRIFLQFTRGEILIDLNGKGTLMSLSKAGNLVGPFPSWEQVFPGPRFERERNEHGYKNDQP